MALPTELKPGEDWTCPNHLCERVHTMPTAVQRRDMSHTCTCGITTSWRPQEDGALKCFNVERAPDAARPADRR